VSFSGRPQSWGDEQAGRALSASESMVPAHRDMDNGQPLPQHNDGPSMHDLVIKDILSRDPRWDVSVGDARHIRDQVANDLLERKQFGLAKYETILQAGNGRDFLRDLYEEVQDAAVYARGRLAEVPAGGLEWLILFEIYDDQVGHLVRLRRLRNAAADTE
jgi:hypothetical protein